MRWVFTSVLGLVVTIGWGVVWAAQPLSDAELDGITAAGSFSVEILPPTAPGAPIAPIPPFKAATAAIKAAGAAIDTALSIQGSSGISVASEAINAASAALQSVSQSNGGASINAATEAIRSASAVIDAVPAQAVTPEIASASDAVKSASTALAGVTVNHGIPSINAAAEAIKAATAAIGAVSLGDVHMQADSSGPAIQAASEAIKAASAAINVASTQGQGNGTSPSALDPAFIDPALLSEFPSVKFAFDAGGGTTGSGSASIPTGSQQSGLTFSGNPILSGNAFQVQNMLLNMNICVQCRASGHIVQTGNGFVFPITIQ